MTGPVESAVAVVEQRRSARWQIPLDEAIEWSEWGDEFVVRSARRAQTHLLSAAAGSVLLALLERSAGSSLEALFACAFGDARSGLDGAMSADERDALRAIVVELERLGLATSSP